MAVTGTFTFKLVRDLSVKGAYTIKLHTGGGEVVAVATDWIPWAKISW